MHARTMRLVLERPRRTQALHRLFREHVAHDHTGTHVSRKGVVAENFMAEIARRMRGLRRGTHDTPVRARAAGAVEATQERHKALALTTTLPLHDCQPGCHVCAV